MSAAITLNGLDAVTARVVIPYRGVWTADVDFDLAAIPVAPTGTALLKIGKSVLMGTIDPGGSGKLGSKGRARVIGGGGGWHKPVNAQHFTSDAGVLSTLVLTTTATQVGEKVVEAQPSILGMHYARCAGPASRILDGLDWYVELTTGITIVGPRLPIPAVPGLIDVLEWDPLEQRAVIASDEVILPGTLIVDTRFGSATVVDVEQTFSGSGSRAVAWCSKSSSTRLASALSTLVRETIRPEYLRAHSYRVVLQGADGRLVLQAIKFGGPVPDMLPVKMCLGVPGFDSKLTPGTEVLVEFADGDPSKPLVVGFAKEAPPPIEVSCNALRVAFGLGTAPLAKATPDFIAWVAAVTTAINSLAPGSAVLPVGLASTRTFSD